jgi:acetyl-CoA synthetase
MKKLQSGEIVWRPGRELVESCTLTAFLREHGLADYDALVRRADEEPEWFWNAIIRRFDIRFFRPFDKVMDSSKGIPWTEWCVGGTTNLTLNCLDKHLEAGRGENEVLIWEGESGESRARTYAELAAEVARLAEGLRALGLGRGDVVGLYMPMIPEAAVAFLAVAKIGAVVLPLFSGFGAGAVASRLADAEAVAVITVDATSRRGKDVPMKAVVDEAAADMPGLRHVIIHRNRQCEVAWDKGRDRWWHEICEGQPAESRTEEMPADAPVMLVYTSGTTGKPKGTVHTHCGFVTKLALDIGLCHDLREGDRLLWMSDFGWVVGPILVVATTLLGGTMVMADGAPDYPDEGRMWRLVQDHRVSILGIAPTIVRSFMKSGGAGVEDYDFSGLRGVISTGEPWTPDAWKWCFEKVCRARVPIYNYSGGTEIGGGIVTGTPLHSLKPCSFGGPVPGMGANVVDETGNRISPGAVGELVLRNPSIGLTRSLWNDPDRYIESYWADLPGLWRQGDWASIDEDGFWYILGRSDDTLKLAGKRTGPAEIEALLMGTGKLAECAVIGVPDEVKGEAVVCACVPLPGVETDGALEAELAEAVVMGLGGPFRPRRILFVADLPKTRNMKVMRRVVRAALLGEEPGDLSSLVNPESVERIAATAARG